MPSIVKSVSQVVAEHILRFEPPPREAVLFRTVIFPGPTYVLEPVTRGHIMAVELPDATTDTQTRRQIEEYMESTRLCPYPTSFRHDEGALVIIAGSLETRLPVGSPSYAWWRAVHESAQKGSALHTVVGRKITYVKDLHVTL